MRMWEPGDPIEGGNDTEIPDVKYFDYLKDGSGDDDYCPNDSSYDFDDSSQRRYLSYDELISNAKKYFDDGDYGAALNCYERAWSMSRKIEALNGKAECLVKLGREKDAGELYCRIANMSEYRDGDKDLVVKYYKKALELDPANEDVLDNLGYTLRMMGRYSEALTYYMRIRQKDVDWAMAMCYMGLKRYDEAIPLLDNLIRINPHRDDFLDEKCECLIELGRKREAIKLYKNLIDFLMAEECYERAVERIDMLLEIVPYDSSIKDKRAECLKNKEILDARFKSIADVMFTYHMYNPNGLDENDLYGFIKFTCKESGESVDDIVRWYRTPMLGSSSFKSICGNYLFYVHWDKILKMYDEGKFRDL